MKTTKTSNSIISFALATTSVTAFAAGAPLTNQFIGGQAASAAQVNANFQELADRIADIPLATTYDYKTYQNAAMQKGMLSGSASEIFQAPAGGSEALSDSIDQTVVVLGIEDITVPAGSYTACLKLYFHRTSTTFGNFNRIAWYCPGGIGEVKRLQNNTESAGYGSWELTNITP